MGLGGTAQASASDVSYNIVVAFFEGRDDNEALAYGMRLAEHPGIVMTLIRFVAPKGKTLGFCAILVGITSDKNKKILEEEDCGDNEKKDDKSLLAEYMNVRKNSGNKEGRGEPSMLYEEKVVDNKAEICVVLKSMAKNVNLFIVGRMPPTAPLVDSSSDYAELGPMGSFLASSNFSSTTLVMVLQQYNPTASQLLVVEEADCEAPDTPIA